MSSRPPFGIPPARPVLDKLVTVYCEQPKLVVFDPARLRHHADEEPWWAGRPHALLSECRAHNLLTIGLAESGTFRVRVTDRPLLEREQDAIRATAEGLCVIVDEGRLALAGAEVLGLIGDGREEPPEDELEVLTLARGRYAITAHRLIAPGLPDLLLHLRRMRRAELAGDLSTPPDFSRV